MISVGLVLAVLSYPRPTLRFEWGYEPGSDPAISPTSIYREDQVWAAGVPIPTYPIYARMAARAQNDATVQALNAECPIVLDVNCDGFVTSQDFFDWYTAFATSGGPQ